MIAEMLQKTNFNRTITAISMFAAQQATGATVSSAGSYTGDTINETSGFRLFRPTVLQTSCWEQRS